MVASQRGTSMVETAVRQRLAAILAADVAGYSRLMAEDERATLSALDGARAVFREKIQSHQGRVVDTAGDSVLATFDTATGAVAAALAVQERLIALESEVAEDRQMRFRIGVHLGDVMEKADGSVYGDGVNIAARLQGLAEPTGITVSDAVQSAVRGRVDATFADQGEQQVKNIVHTVHAYRLVKGPVRDLISGIAEHSGKGAIEKPSIAVLPFANMSGDPEQEYFADGISEDIITGLSRLRWFLVIARNSSFAYKGKAMDVKRVARELGVRYVLEGSVRKAGNRVRITAQLVDASSGNHVWADRYDGDLADIFELQDQITMKVVAAIEPRLLEAEGIRSQSRSPEDIGAWDMVMQANSLFWRMAKAEGERAIAVLRQAVECYPEYGPAHSMLAFMLLVTGYLGRELSQAEATQAAMLAARAAELDDSDPWAHLALGFTAFVMRRTDEAAEECRRALDLNPNFAAAHGYLGWALAFDGRSDEAISHLERAILMSPQDPQNAIFSTGLAVAHYLTGQFSEAVSSGRKALQLRYGFTPGHRIYVASLAQAGQVDEAHEALARLKELQPDLSIGWIERHVPYTSGSMAKFVEGMRKAGLE